MSSTTQTPQCNVVAFVADRWEHVCPTIRVTSPLQQAGISVTRGNDWENDELHFYTERINEADIILVQRDFPKYREVFEEILALAREQNKPIVYEIDDLLVDLPLDHPDYDLYRQSRAAILWAVAEADIVTVSTPPLRHYFQKFNKHVHVLPNCLVDDIWHDVDGEEEPSSENDDGLITIGFMGGHGHTADLAYVEPALEHVLRSFPNIRFISIGCPLPDRLDRHPSANWKAPGLVEYAEFVRHFRQYAHDIDIFVAPLRPSNFNAHKSGLKYLEYSALGVAGVYSHEGQFPDLIQHGVTGFLANSVEQWIEYLTQLLRDTDLRYRMGTRAQQDVKQWLLSRHAHKWAYLYGTLVNHQRPSRGAVSFPFLPALTAWYQEVVNDYQALLETRRSELEALHAQIASLEKYISSLNQHIALLDEQNRHMETELSMIKNSPGWKLLGMVWPVRALLIPPGSRREMAFQRCIQALWVLRERGIAGTVAALRRREKHPQPHPPSPPAVQLVPGQKAPSPLFSLIVQDPSLVEPLQTWLASQTWQDVEVVVWDTRGRRARRLPQEEHTIQHVPDFPTLLQALKGEYIGFVSPKLLTRRATYLEENAAALRGETLGFTLNTSSSATLIEASVQRGRIVMDPSELLVHRSLLKGPSTIDPRTWPQPTVGKVIFAEGEEHTSGQPHVFEVRQARLSTQWPYVLRHEDSSNHRPTPSVRPLHPVETVLPILAPPREKPTVLLVMPFLAVGGAERIALDMMRYLAQALNFVVVATDPREAALGTMADAFRHVVPQVYILPNFLAPELRLSFFNYLIETWQPKTLYVANGSPWIYDELVPTIKARFPDIRAVNQVYDHRMGWINRYDAELIEQFDAHIGPNRTICQEYLRRGVPPEHVHLVEHGIDVHEYDPARYTPDQIQALRRRLELPEDKRIVTFIARIHPQKRPLDFVELARRFADDPSILFLMVGDGPLTGTVDAEVQRIGLPNLVRRPFYRPSRDIFAISDVIVLPSEYEGMPMVVLEAQAMGKPVVVTDVGNTREVLEITRGGVVVSRIGDVGALRDGVRTMLESPPDPAHMRRAIVEHFSWERIAPKYHAVLVGAQPSQVDAPTHFTGAPA